MARAEALDHAWDLVIRGQADDSAPLSPADVATIQSIHANTHRPEPNPAFAQRLREELMGTTPLTANPDGVMPFSPNSHRSVDHRALLASSFPRPSNGRWRLPQFTTTALVVLVIAAALLAVGSERWGSVPSTGNEDLAIIPAVSTPTNSGTPTAEAIAVETLLDAVVTNLPAGSGTMSLLRWTLQPSAQALVVPAAEGPRFFAVESGEVTVTEASVEHRLGAGESYLPADPEQEIAIRVSGPEAATLLRGVVAKTLASASFDGEVHHYDFLLDAYSDALPGGSGRLVFERVTLAPGSALSPTEVSPFVWTTLGAGTLGMTLEGDDLPFPFMSGKERTVQSVGALPTTIAPGTRMTLRNAGDSPLILLRLALTPVTTKGVAATPAP
jgi:hypothetical protein